ncbi:VOC family protein [Thalassotalea litorea]|uniref:VOC family protein n=1 Tax=Thalassotalea litorea TaxID=2020715 RepID=A0A5R9ITQ4_9GAMM|nr:VOC family protein [Thalassotalea litorea]TLU67487.1 VOC family protein [Thalassotalea litorea]
MTAKPIPDGYHSVTPYLICKNALAAIEFYQQAFNAETKLVLKMPDGGVAHGEIMIGNSHVMLADEQPQMNFVSPDSLGGSPVSLMIYLNDVDTAFSQAVNAGAIVIREVEDQFYGDRAGTLKDPFGHTWTLATHVQDLSEDELEQKFQALMGQDPQ